VREIVFGSACGLAVALAALAVAAWPRPGRPAAAFFAAGISQPAMARAVADAGGALVAFGPRSVIAADMDRPSALYAAGAWLVVDASFARLCLGREFADV